MPTSPAPGPAPLTAGTVRDLVFARCAVTAAQCPNDVFHSGTADDAVRGVVTTFQATVAVIRQAAARGASLIVTHEPTFWLEQPEFQRRLERDPVRLAKAKLLADHGIAIWRCHDALHRCASGDIITAGVERRLGWPLMRGADGVYTLPGTPLATLAAELGRKLGSGAARYVGDPGQVCRSVAMCLGAHWSLSQMQALLPENGGPGADVVICGESREWETPEYVRDALALGHAKAVILVGHAASEEAGMDELGDWLRTQLTGLAVAHLPCGDPFRIAG